MINGFGLDRVGLLAARHPRWSAALIIFLIMATVFGLPKLRFDNDLDRTFLSYSQISEDYLQFRKKLDSKTEDIIILAQSKEPFTIADYAAMRSLSLELQLDERVKFVLSPFSMRFPQTNKDYPGEAVFLVNLNKQELDSRLSSIRNSKHEFRRVISEDMKSAIIVVAIDRSKITSGIESFVKKIVTGSRELNTKNIHYTVAGKLPAAIDLVRGLQHDLVALNLLGNVFATLITLLIFRNLRNAALAVVPAILGAFVSLSVYIWFDYPITVINNVIPVLILVLALADSIHLTLHFKSDLSQKAAADRLIHTIKEISPACGLTTITTAIAFAAIAISDNGQLVEFAVLGAASVILSHIVVVLTFVVLAPYADSTPRGERGAPRWVQVPPLVRSLVFNRSKYIIISSLIVAVLSAWGYSRAEAWFSFDRSLPESSDVLMANKILQEQFGGIYRMWIELDTSGENALTTQQGWKRLIELNRAIEAVAPDTPAVSLVSIARWVGTPEKLPTSNELKRIPGYLTDQLYSEKDKVARIVLSVPEPMHSSATLKTHDAIVKAALSSGANTVTGLPVVVRHESISLINQLGSGLLLACFIAIILIGIVFRWYKLVLILILPNVLPLIITACSVHLFNNGKFDPIAVLALTVAFGIAVDDSIHLVNRYCLLVRKGQSFDQALSVAIDQAGRAMIATTLLISMGMLASLISDFSTVRLFGKMLTLALVIALICDLLLLPALLRQKVFQR